MDTKPNILMLLETLGLSKLVYAASMLCVPLKWYERKNCGKTKRCYNYTSLCRSGGQKFPNFRTMVKLLRLSWLSRFLNSVNESWQAIPNDVLNRYGGIPFLLKCNYDSINF